MHGYQKDVYTNGKQTKKLIQKKGKGKQFKISLLEAEEWISIPETERIYPLAPPEVDDLDEDEQDLTERERSENESENKNEKKLMEDFVPTCKYWPRETVKGKRKRIQRRLGLAPPFSRRDSLEAGYSFEEKVSEEDYLPEVTLSEARLQDRDLYHQKKYKKQKI